MKKCLVVFDFDHTIIHENSDQTILDCFKLFYKDNNLKIEDLLSKNNIHYEPKKWTQFMGQIFQLMHQIGITEKDMVAV